MRTIELGSLEELIANTPRGVKLLFIADVGATNTRVSFVPTLTSTSEVYFFKSKAGSVPEMLSFFEATAEKAGPKIASRIIAAAVAVPGPVTENGSIATVANFKAADNEGRTVRVRDLPSRLCPVGRTRLLNDLHACGAGIAGLHHIGAFAAAFSKMWGPGDSGGQQPAALGKGSVVVLAPGTGLGTALLHYDPATHRFVVVPLEFGHTHVSTFRHSKVLNSFVKRLDRGDHPAEFDDICTGRGLEHIYEATLEFKNALSLSALRRAPEISKAASEGDADALASFRVMYAILMNLASQLAMGFVPHTVAIAGDNAVRHKFFLGDAQNAAAMRDEFYAHTMERMGFMSRVQLVRQSTEMNLNLVGAAFEASQMAQPRAKL